MIAYIYFMYLSMLTPGWGGGGRSDPGEFDIFTRARVKFPTPGLLENVKFPPLGTAFCPKQVVAISNSRPQGRSRMSKSPHREKLAERCLQRRLRCHFYIYLQICINFVFRLKKKTTTFSRFVGSRHALLLQSLLFHMFHSHFPSFT